MSTPSAVTTTAKPPTKHELALMIWVAVFPTLTVLNLLFGSLLDSTPVVLRTFILATVAVPIVIYGLMPQLHRARRAITTRPRQTDSTNTSLDGGFGLESQAPSGTD